LTVSANEKGKIDVSTVINSPIKIGGHAIAINGYKRPKPIWVIDKPDVYFVRDTFPAYVNWQDTIEVYGTGFPADRAVSVYLDSIQVEYTSKITTDARGKFRSKVLIPYAADGNYHVVAKTDDENVGSSPAIIRNSRSYNLELENLWPPIVQEGESMQDYLGYFELERTILSILPGTTKQEARCAIHIASCRYVRDDDVGYKGTSFW
jgi:hypothetical protein